jgi:hypothetical protein
MEVKPLLLALPAHLAWEEGKQQKQARSLSRFFFDPW